MTIMAGAEPISIDGSDVGVVLCHGYPSMQSMRAAWLGRASLPRPATRCGCRCCPGMGTNWRINATGWQDWYGELEVAYEQLARRDPAARSSPPGCRWWAAGHQARAREAALAGLVVVNPIYAHTNPALRILPLLQHVLPSLGGIAGDIKKPGVVELAYYRNPLRSMYSQTRLWRIVVEDLPHLRLPCCWSPRARTTSSRRSRGRPSGKRANRTTSPTSSWRTRTTSPPWRRRAELVFEVGAVLRTGRRRPPAVGP